MAEVNLLPSKRRKILSFAEAGRSLRGVGFAVALVFFIVSLVFVLLIIFNQSKIDSLKKKESSLRDDLKALSEVETEYNFIEDRAQKAQVVLSSRDALKRAEDLKSFLDKTASWNLDKAEVDKGALSFSLTFFSYQDLVKLVSAIKEDKNYTNVVVDSLEFSPTSGYKLQVDLKI